MFSGKMRHGLDCHPKTNVKGIPVLLYLSLFFNSTHKFTQTLDIKELE